MAGKKKTKEQLRLALRVCRGELESLHDELEASQEIRARLEGEAKVLKAEGEELWDGRLRLQKLLNEVANMDPMDLDLDALDLDCIFCGAVGEKPYRTVKHFADCLWKRIREEGR